jgi:hypothetical protein
MSTDHKTGFTFDVLDKKMGMMQEGLTSLSVSKPALVLNPKIVVGNTTVGQDDDKRGNKNETSLLIKIKSPVPLGVGC